MIAKEEWRQQRLGKLTASNIHKLMSEGRHGKAFSEVGASYINEVVAEALTGEAAEVSSISMEWGLLHEPQAIAAYAKRVGVEPTYYGSENPLFIPYGDWLGGSPDGITKKHLLEVKCPYNSAVHIANMQLDATSFFMKRFEYYCQMQFNMLLTGKALGHFISYDPRMACSDHQLFVLEVKADDLFQEEMMGRVLLAVDKLKKILKAITSKSYAIQPIHPYRQSTV